MATDSGPQILIFESDPAFATELHVELERLGARPRIVEDGNLGLQIAIKEPPDLVLLSVELPRGNGYSVCKYLKMEPTLKDIPVIMMSGNPNENFEQHKKLRIHADSYVRKPIALGELLLQIQQFIQLDAPNLNEAQDILFADDIADDIEDEDDDDDQGTQVMDRSALASMGLALPQQPARATPVSTTPLARPSAQTPASVPPASIEQPPPSVASRSTTVDVYRHPSPATSSAQKLDEVDSFADNAFDLLVESSPAPPQSAKISGSSLQDRKQPAPSTLAHSSAEIEALRAELEKAKAHKAEADKIHIELEKERQNASITLKKISLLEQQKSTAEHRIQELEKRPAEVIPDPQMLQQLAQAQTELQRLQAELAQRHSQPPGPARTGTVSSRELLDLRDALNRKDREILSLREQQSQIERELLNARDASLELERSKADLEDQVQEISQRLDTATEETTVVRAMAEQLRADLERQRAEATTALEHEKNTAAAALREREDLAAREQDALKKELEAHQEKHQRELQEFREQSQQNLQESAAKLQAQSEQVVADLQARAQRELEHVRAEAQREINEQTQQAEQVKQELQAQHEQAMSAAAAAAAATLAAALASRSDELSAKHREEQTMLQSKLDAAEQRIASEQKNLEETQAKLAHHVTNEGKLQATVEELQRASAEHARALEELNTKVLEEQAATAKSIQKYQEERTLWETSRGELEGKLSAAEQALIGVNRQQEESQVQKEDLQKQILDLQQKVKSTEEASQQRRTMNHESIEQLKDALATALAQIESIEGRE